METLIYRFTAAELRTVPSEYLGFLIASAHCCNELTILLPYIIFEHKIATATETEISLILTRKYTLDRILVSKIVEYGELWDVFIKRSDRSDKFIASLAERFSPITEKLKSAKWARILRNKVSFHYDFEHAAGAVIRFPDDFPMKFTAGKAKGVTLYDFAEEIVSRPVFESAGGGDIGHGMDVTHTFIEELISAITTFHASAHKQLIPRTGRLDRDMLRDEYCATPDEVFIPLSISESYLTNRHKPGTKKRKRG